MLTDWLIYLDFLEENNQNTSFLRFVTPITFAIIECHYCNYTKGDGNGYGSGYGDGDGNCYSDGSGYGDGYGYGFGYGYGDGNGNGNGSGYDYLNSHNEEH